MADKYFIEDPVASDNMRENADFFETLAIEMHSAATEDDSQYQAPSSFVRFIEFQWSG